MIKRTVRSLARAPTFTLTATISIALAIGLLASYSSYASSVSAMPEYANAGRLVEIWGTESPKSGTPSDFLPAGRLEIWINSSFQHLEGLAGRGIGSRWTLRATSGNDHVAVQVILGDYFRLTGEPAAVGRVLSTADFVPDAPAAAVVSHSYARKFYEGGDALGQVLTFVHGSYTIVGVMPARFETRDVVWVPAAHVPERLHPSVYEGIGLLSEASTHELAARELRQRSAVEHAADSMAWGGAGVTARVLGQRSRDANRGSLLLLGGVVAAVLVIGLGNISTLYWVRANEKLPSLAVHTAFGASRKQLALQLALEGATIGASGGLLGGLLAYWGAHVIGLLVPTSAGHIIQPQLDLTTSVMAAAAGVLLSAVAAVLPLRYCTADNMRGSLAAGSRSHGTSRQRWSRRVAVSIQVGACVVLTATTALVIIAMERYKDVSMGYDAEHIAVAIPDYTDKPAGFSEWQFAFDVMTVPVGSQVNRAAWRYVMQSFPPREETNVVPDGAAYEIPPSARAAGYYEVTPEFFDVLGVPTISGRPFRETDDKQSPAVVIVNRRAAEAWWPDSSPLGRQVKIGSDGVWMTVVGVVENTQLFDHLGRSFGTFGRFPPLFFRPAAQASHTPAGWSGAGCISCAGVVFGTQVDTHPEQAYSQLRKAINTVDESVPIQEVGTLLDLQMSSGYGRRLRSTERLVSVAAATGYILAMLGIAGLVAIGVSTRRQEVGVRLALGSPPSRILLAVARETLVSVAIGIIVSLIGLVLISRWAEGRVVPIAFTSLGASYINPVVLLATAIVMSIVALATALCVSLRALRISPLETLRQE